MSFDLHLNENISKTHFERLCSKPHFETEPNVISEMAYCSLLFYH